MNRNLLLLTLCQGLFLTNNVVFIAINGLVGLQLAPAAWMATLPLTAYVGGGALATALVANHQRRFGRQRSFMQGLAVAFFSAGLCAVATWQQSFGLLLLGTVLAGYYNANGALYRFAAAEVVGPNLREKAISWVLAGGILGAVVGPNLASSTRTVLPQAFMGSYLALMVVAALAAVVMSRIQFPPPPDPGAPVMKGRSILELAAQPTFVVAVAAAALSYGVMNLLMAATPIAMAQCKHPFSDAAFVLEWHVLGMFVPSFFTGHLIKRFGALPIMFIGLLLNFACVAFALSGTDLMHFVGALFALGVGWNFLYIGGTTLLTNTYLPHEKTTAQGTMDFCVYATMTLTSFSSGALVTTGGWQFMNYGSLVPLLFLTGALSWLALRQRAPQNERSI
jgi:MFS family permease